MAVICIPICHGIVLNSPRPLTIDYCVVTHDPIFAGMHYKDFYIKRLHWLTQTGREKGILTG